MNPPAIVTNSDIPPINPYDSPTECMIETIHYAITNGWLPTIDYYSTYRFCCTHSIYHNSIMSERLEEVADAAVEWING